MSNWQFRSQLVYKNYMNFFEKKKKSALYFNNISRIHTINVKNEGEYNQDIVAPPKYYIKNPCNDNKSYVTLEFFS